MDVNQPQIYSLESALPVTATFKPEKHHEAFPGILNGGIIGAILDCHANWSAAWYLMQQQQLDVPPCTVTAEYKIKLLRPTPTDQVFVFQPRVMRVHFGRHVVGAVVMPFASV